MQQVPAQAAGLPAPCTHPVASSFSGVHSVVPAALGAPGWVAVAASAVLCQRGRRQGALCAHAIYQPVRPFALVADVSLVGTDLGRWEGAVAAVDVLRSRARHPLVRWACRTRCMRKVARGKGRVARRAPAGSPPAPGAPGRRRTGRSWWQTGPCRPLSRGCRDHTLQVEAARWGRSWCGDAASRMGPA